MGIPVLLCTLQLREEASWHEKPALQLKEGVFFLRKKYKTRSFGVLLRYTDKILPVVPSIIHATEIVF